MGDVGYGCLCPGEVGNEVLKRQGGQAAVVVAEQLCCLAAAAIVGKEVRGLPWCAVQ